ncbi:hypothetical protein STEPF1_02239 [Streptomyces sp. F-1]|nr:hypothetical protein STEPF1_02239 [Streptomyces sp. F-1]
MPTPAGRARLARHPDAGGGFAGVHAAACTEYGWPYHGTLLGARFTRHPAYRPGRALVADPGHPATRTSWRIWTADSPGRPGRREAAGPIYSPRPSSDVSAVNGLLHPSE